MLSMDLIKGLAKYAEEHRGDLSNNEESTKHSLVLPLIQALGYNIFHKMEVDPEFTADIGTKKGEKVDYAIMRDGEPVILVECKAVNKTLNTDVSQLYRYFTPTRARFGVLTNGVVYRFFSDLSEPNIMDQSPFLEVDIRTANQSDVAELQRFAKNSFDPEKIKADAKAAAMEANIIHGVKANLERMYDNPEDNLFKGILRDVVEGNLTDRRAASHHELVKRAFHEFARDLISTESSGAFPQEASASASQSASEQAATTVVPSSPSPNAPTGEWQSISDIQPKLGDVKPTQMMFPNDSVVGITTWNQVVIQAVRWLANDGRLDARHCPIQRTTARYLVATQPIHPSGKDFTNAREVNSLHVELSYNLLDMVANTKFIIEHAGMDASQFKVRW